MFIKIDNNIVTEILDGDLSNKEGYTEVPDYFNGCVGCDTRWFDKDFNNKSLIELVQENLITLSKDEYIEDNTIKTRSYIDMILLGLEDLSINEKLVEENGIYHIEKKSDKELFECGILDKIDYNKELEKEFYSNKKEKLIKAINLLLNDKQNKKFNVGIILSYNEKKQIKQYIKLLKKIRFSEKIEWPIKPEIVKEED